ncbi:MAG TPA: endonuclease domain-containing protein, partial [Candidatus Hypogeohydataceae bacterium YC41]
MTEIFNKKEHTKKRKHLRKNMTKAEIFLWSKLKRRQLNGLKFRRQYGIDDYTVDFYCPELKLAIEIDGDVHIHNPRIIYDEQRQRYIEALGIKVLRYTNIDVIKNINGVLHDILATSPVFPPPKGGDTDIAFRRDATKAKAPLSPPLRVRNKDLTLPRDTAGKKKSPLSPPLKVGEKEKV